MTLRILIINDVSNPTDRAVEVEQLGSSCPNPSKRVLMSGQAMDGYIYEGNEFHIKEVEPPAE